MLDRNAYFALRPVSISVTTGVPETIKVRGKRAETQPATVRWADQERHVWLDEYSWPVQVQRDNLFAVTTQYARYV